MVKLNNMINNMLIRYQKGFTLIELLVSLAILSIVIGAFTSLIGWNFFSISNSGIKSEAIAKAMEKTDQLYAVVWNDDNPEDAMKSINGWVSCDDLFIDSSRSKELVFCFKKYDEDTPKIVNDAGVTKEIQGYDISVVVFYQEGKYFVKLDSFIKIDK